MICTYHSGTSRWFSLAAIWSVSQHTKPWLNHHPLNYTCWDRLTAQGRYFVENRGCFFASKDQQVQLGVLGVLLEQQNHSVYVLAAGTLLNGSASCRRTDLTSGTGTFCSFRCLSHPLDASVYPNIQVNYTHVVTHTHVGFSGGQQMMQECRNQPLCGTLNEFFFSLHKQPNITKLLNDCVYCITHSTNHSLAKKSNNLGFTGLFLGKYFQVWQCLLNFKHDGMCKNMLEVFICHSLAVSLLHLFSLPISWCEETKILPLVNFVTQFFLSTCSVHYFCLTEVCWARSIVYSNCSSHFPPLGFTAPQKICFLPRGPII